MKTEKDIQAGERTQGLIKGIEDLFKMMDEGILVRDTSRDEDADFYKRNLDFVMRLARIKQVLDEAKPPASNVIGIYDSVVGILNECCNCHDRFTKIIVCRDTQLCEACFGKTEVATII